MKVETLKRQWYICFFFFFNLLLLLLLFLCKSFDLQTKCRNGCGSSMVIVSMEANII